MGFIRELREVVAHGNTKLHVIHTNDLQTVQETIKNYEKHLKHQRKKIVGVEVEYTNEPAHEQKAALVQLSVGKTQPVILFQLSIADNKCPAFDNFLLNSRYTFVGFFIDQDIKKLERVGLEIGNFVDIQKEWRAPESTNYFDSLGNITSLLIDDYYFNMKYKLTYEDHRRWDTMPLTKKHIEYAAKDAYTTYEIWNRITLTQDGLRRAKMEKSKKRARTSGHYGE